MKRDARRGAFPRRDNGRHLPSSPTAPTATVLGQHLPSLHLCSGHSANLDHPLSGSAICHGFIDNGSRVVLTNATKSTTAEETYKAVGIVGTVWDAMTGAVGTTVGIANVALGRLGAKRISAIDEDTENARKVRAIYGSIRDEEVMHVIESIKDIIRYN